MPGQGDLQDWLKQLKQRSEGQGSSAPALKRGRERSAGGVAMSATDVALAKLKLKEERDRKKKRESDKKRAGEVKKRAIEKLTRENEQAHEAVKVESRSKKAPESLLGSPLSLRSNKPVGGKGSKIKLSSLHKHLNGNRGALREAVILSEILGPPRSMQKDIFRY